MRRREVAAQRSHKNRTGTKEVTPAFRDGVSRFLKKRKRGHNLEKGRKGDGVRYRYNTNASGPGVFFNTFVRQSGQGKREREVLSPVREE